MTWEADPRRVVAQHPRSRTAPSVESSLDKTGDLAGDEPIARKGRMSARLGPRYGLGGRER